MILNPGRNEHRLERSALRLCAAAQFRNRAARPRALVVGTPANCVPGASGTVSAADITLTLMLAAWSLPDGTLLPASMASATSHGSVVALLSVTGGQVTVSSPSGSTMVLTGPMATPQTVTNVAASADATLTAGSNAGSALGTAATLTVGTSITSDHSATSVAVLTFAVPAIAAGQSMTAALLELTIATGPANYMVMSGQS